MCTSQAHPYTKPKPTPVKHVNRIPPQYELCYRLHMAKEPIWLTFKFFWPRMSPPAEAASRDLPLYRGAGWPTFTDSVTQIWTSSPLHGFTKYVAQPQQLLTHEEHGDKRATHKLVLFYRSLWKTFVNDNSQSKHCRRHDSREIWCTGWSNDELKLFQQCAP